MKIVDNDEFAKVFKNITNQCKKHLVKVADIIGKEGMESSDLISYLFGQQFHYRLNSMK